MPLRLVGIDLRFSPARQLVRTTSVSALRILAVLLLVPSSAFSQFRLPPDILLPVQIGSQTFHFARNIIDGGAGGAGKQAAVLLFVVYPRMMPWSDPSEGGKAGIVQSSKALQILLADPRVPSDPGRTAKRDVNQALSTKLITGANLGLALASSVRRRDPVGLDLFSPSDETGAPSQSFKRYFKEGYRYYARMKDDDVEYFVACSGERSVPNPGCQLILEYKALTLQITFRQRLLPEWDAIRQSVVNFLDAATVIR